jgi:hypothetical protein
VLRSFVTNHVIHHRGQLSVYLRLNDVPVPSIYVTTRVGVGPFTRRATVPLLRTPQRPADASPPATETPWPPESEGGGDCFACL